MEDAADRPVSPPSDRLAAAASELRVVISRLLRQLRAQHSHHELTPSQAVVLGRLGTDGPATVAALARAESVRPQSMRLTLGALEERGLVERAPHPTDQRQVLMSPTPAGNQLLDAARLAKEDWLARAMATKLSPAEQDSLLAAIPVLRRLLEP
ncbi:MarR family winged helix-turn-helix transcriptional regulator [Nocardia transvalensis]|uniref:MarR family winged helix-turn-helix transcriptional regulator n=1 Tax=Nocardia transvalensis TaxID=37333 RepID=UPI0018949A44|nr:MarR family transcriptional regulator [Nocardia transvalensis]MBF6329643.1 MarR family transcriptional regulator [Nocardia transvalensis]